MPQDQFKDVFGSDVKYWETLYKGEKVEYLRLGYKIHSNCFYVTKIDCLDIIATDVNIYRIIEEHDQVQKNLTLYSHFTHVFSIFTPYNISITYITCSIFNMFSDIPFILSGSSFIWGISCHLFRRIPLILLLRGLVLL